MTPPRGIPHITERPSEIRERSSEGVESSRDLALVLAEREPVELDSLRRFARDTNLAPRTESSLGQFQALPQARLVVRDSGKPYHPSFVLKFWHQAWQWVTQSGETYHPVFMIKRLYQAWRGGSLAAMPLEGIELMLGEGAGERVRVDGDVTTLQLSQGERGLVVGQAAAEVSDGPSLDVVFSDPPSVDSRHAEFFREGGKVFLRDLGSKNGTWIWNRNNATWTRIEPEQPLEVKSGVVLAFGTPPTWQDIVFIPERGREPEAVLVAIRPSPKVDAFQIRRIQAKSLQYFLSDVSRTEDLSLRVVDASPDKTSAETAGLMARSGLDRELFRLTIAARLETQGFPKEALREVEAAESAMGILESAYRPGRFVNSSAKITPEEILLERAFVDLYEMRARLLEEIQEPEAAAVIYGRAVAQLEALLKHQPKNETQRYEWFSYRAHRLFYQKAERDYRNAISSSPQGEVESLQRDFASAAVNYELAAHFSEAAQACQDTMRYRGAYANHSVFSTKVLLRKAVDAYLRAGLPRDAERVRINLHPVPH